MMYYYITIIIIKLGMATPFGIETLPGPHLALSTENSQISVRRKKDFQVFVSPHPRPISFSSELDSLYRMSLGKITY